MQVAFTQMMTAKQQLRRQMRHLSTGMHCESAAITDAVSSWLTEHPRLRHIALYSALPGEVDLSELLISRSDRLWYFPRVFGENLLFHAVTNPRLDLVLGTFGIREPSPAVPVVELALIDVFLCPGLAFDPRGGRLGRGRGYYDRLLAYARPDAMKIGVCFPQQLVPDTFTEPHDIPMDLIISDSTKNPAPPTRNLES